jgi:hypothetical protein
MRVSNDNKIPLKILRVKCNLVGGQQLSLLLTRIDEVIKISRECIVIAGKTRDAKIRARKRSSVGT